MKIQSIKDLNPYYTEEDLLLMSSEELSAAGFTHPQLYGTPEQPNRGTAGLRDHGTGCSSNHGLTEPE